MTPGDGLEFDDGAPRCQDVHTSVAGGVLVAAVSMYFRQSLAASSNQAVKGALDVVHVEGQMVQAVVGQPCCRSMRRVNFKDLK